MNFVDDNYFYYKKTGYESFSDIPIQEDYARYVFMLTEEITNFK